MASGLFVPGVAEGSRVKKGWLEARQRVDPLHFGEESRPIELGKIHKLFGIGESRKINPIVPVDNDFPKRGTQGGNLEDSVHSSSTADGVVEDEPAKVLVF